MKQVLLYLPVVHAGHEGFFARHADAAEVLILGTGFREQFKSLAKDIRALPPARAAQFLQVMLPGTRIRVIEPADLPAVLNADTLVLPDEDITRTLAAEHRLGEGRTLVFDKTFLRWDREWSQASRPADPDGTLKIGELPPALIAQAAELAGHSSDWWRQVGAIAWRDEKVLGWASDVEDFYLTKLLPHRVDKDLDFLKDPSLGHTIRWLATTFLYLIHTAKPALGPAEPDLAEAALATPADD